MVFIIGFLAQICFFARTIIQWIISEKSKKVISPVIFWQLSLLGSYLLFLYGWLRDDFTIISGQLISYYIYIWNLNIKEHWKGLPRPARYLLLLTPFAVILYIIFHPQIFITQFFQNENIPLELLIFGFLGQIIFALRFVYQLIYSIKKHESTLPSGFWLISLTGSVIIVSYALMRRDPVLILGQSMGILAYSRNIWLAYHTKRQTQI